MFIWIIIIQSIGEELFPWVTWWFTVFHALTGSLCLPACQRLIGVLFYNQTDGYKVWIIFIRLFYVNHLCAEYIRDSLNQTIWIVYITMRLIIWKWEERVLHDGFWIKNVMKNRRDYSNCWDIHVHHNIYITKLWALCSYFLYLYMVFLQHCFHSEQDCFPFRTDSFQCSTNISN